MFFKIKIYGKIVLLFEFLFFLGYIYVCQNKLILSKKRPIIPFCSNSTKLHEQPHFLYK